MKSLSKLWPGLLAIVLSNTSVNANEWSASLRQAELLLSAGDYNKAQVEYERQARLGNGLAQFTLGLFYQLGWGVNISPAQSCSWFKLAAENQLPAAQEQLGYCYLKDHFNTAEQQLAYHWFEQAYQAGIHSAGCALGKLYIDGKYIVANQLKGVQLCQQAAMAGATAAQLQLAKWLLEGRVLQQDARLAMHWFDVAAKNNSAEAAFYIAQFYDTGTVVGKDAVQALVWYELAASRGFTDAYLPAAALHWAQYNAALDSTNNGLNTAAEHLAKAYVWASTAIQLSPAQRSDESNQTLLRQITIVMPVSWQAELQHSIDAHLKQFSSSTHSD